MIKVFQSCKGWLDMPPSERSQHWSKLQNGLHLSKPIPHLRDNDNMNISKVRPIGVFDLAFLTAAKYAGLGTMIQNLLRRWECMATVIAESFYRPECAFLHLLVFPCNFRCSAQLSALNRNPCWGHQSRWHEMCSGLKGSIPCSSFNYLQLVASQTWCTEEAMTDGHLEI
jgi:hypothetical protein